MSAIPERFDDSLAARTFPHKFRRVGNPNAFLNDVGIVPMLEYIYKGNLLIDVAEALNVSYTILTKWVENEGHQDAIDEAQKISAEGYLAEGLRRLRNAGTEFELKRAKEMVAHARFMASKKDKTQYGNNEQTGVERAGVSYVFNIGGIQTVQNVVKAEDTDKPEVIEGEVVEVADAPKPVALDILGHLDGKFEDIFGVPPIAPPSKHVVKVPQAPRPKVKATAENPELGPFHD